ncbi:MAG TPA: type II toxin-antitoxin system RelE/ParE family toxin [Gallionellaceae bacterium]|nr:type II toxin-antitoxin system RelE/ParE family toxin [Gallionellaceae bacterium]
MRWWICRLASVFYEQQQEGLGAYFLDSLFSDIDGLLLYAGIHQQFSGYFRALSKRFPYAIYYRVSGETIQIWRVLDCRQRPAIIKKALR